MTPFAIHHVRITPIAFRDPPLLNAAGIHERWSLRAIIEIKTACGRVGINETYGDLPMLEALAKAAPALQGLSPWSLNTMEYRVAALVTPAKTGSVFLGEQISLAPGTHVSKTVAKVISAFEVAMLDLQGQLTGAPIVDLLGGAARDAVPFGAYLFFKYAELMVQPYAADSWGEGSTPEQMVAQARQMISTYDFKSIKLKDGALPPEQEVQTLLALAQAFPGAQLCIDPIGNWTVPTSLNVVKQLRGVLEYYEDPAPVLEGVAEVAEKVQLGCPVRIVLSDHHYWDGLRSKQQLSSLCQTFDMGLSMYSNEHLGISLMTMMDLADLVPHLTYACDIHYPCQDDEVVKGGSLHVPRSPGLGVCIDHTALERPHDNYLHCGIHNRDDLGQMRRYEPSFTGKQPRF